MLDARRPGKIVCVGRNYRDHAKELGNEVPKEPLLFLKPPSSVIHSGELIVLPPQSRQVEFEGEVGVIIGTHLSQATEREAAAAIRGVCAVNDVTARDLQKTDGQWTRAKGFDTFCALGPEVSPPRDLDQISVVTLVNDVERQRGMVADMVFSIPAVLAYISGIMTLEPGDLVATGTPAGVGPIAAGDVVEIQLSHATHELSFVRNPVTSRP
jgi:2-keto-4-pentenoate hydratase/2-oxohepta-3-ene-1,7-dioic acid hydratase in catechol pathway